MNIPKPPHGSPCNGCGYCCKDQLCVMASSLLNKPLRQFNPGPCPFLEQKESRFVCGLVVNPAKHAPFVVAQVGAEKASEHAVALIGGGIGCDAQQEGEPYSPEFGRKMDAHRSKHQVKFSHAIHTWIVRGRDPLRALL